MAIFGREGADLAARWTAPAAGTKVEDAFNLYLNYDGAGSKVAGTSVRATSSNVDVVGSYAIVDATHVYVLLFNKATSATTLGATIAGPALGASAVAYRFDGTNRLGAAGTVAVGGGALSTTLPAMSATLLVVPLAAVPVPAGTPWHWVLLGSFLLVLGIRRGSIGPRLYE
jgi:hypothetical protein